jgi:hypothetical protein
MTAADIQKALVKHLDWWATFVIPEFSIAAHRADVIQITKARYATEYEIKVSAADWRADLEKMKWEINPETGGAHISRFYYVVPGRRAPQKPGEPVELEPSIRVPKGLPAGAGILLVLEDGRVREHLAAKRHKARPLPEEIRRRAMDAFYYRYWRLLAEHRRVLGDYRDLQARQARPA